MFDFRSLFTDQPQRERVPGLGHDGGDWRIKPTTLLEDESDERFPAFQHAWKQGAGIHDLFGDKAFILHGSVGRSGTDNHRPDVAKVETLLGEAGYYRPMTDDGPSGWHNTKLDHAIRAFQKDKGLAVDGVLKPGGPTIRALEGAVGGSLPSASAGSPAMHLAQAGGGAESDAAPEGQQEANAAAARLLPLAAPLVGAAGEALRKAWEGDRKDVPGNQPPSPGSTLPPPPATPPSAPTSHPNIPPAPERPTAPPDQPSAPATPDLDFPALEEDMRRLLNGPLESRGSPRTQKGNDIGIRECLDVVKSKWPDMAGLVEHVAGGTKDGKGEEKLKEEVIKNIDTGKWLGGNRPDITFEFGGKYKDRYRINTATMKGDGRTMIPREETAIDRIRHNVASDLVNSMPKFTKGMAEAEYQAIVREYCLKYMTEWNESLVKGGKLPAPGGKDKK